MPRAWHRVGILPLLLLALVFTGCSSLRKDYIKNPSYALPEPERTDNTRQIQRQLALHPEGQSGFRLLALSADALVARLALAAHAANTIDVQYYIFHDDPTGRLVARHLLDAADRGVRVRILLDDIHIAGKDRDLLALDAHPNIEVRLFNPFKNRSSSILSLSTQFILEGRRLNRRMHNKSFIVDNQVAIIGGRNIGDEYFDARQDTNYRDLDVIAVGPVVQEISASFDTFWNSDAAFPVTAFYARRVQPNDLERLRVTIDKEASTAAFITNRFRAAPPPDTIPDGETSTPALLPALNAPNDKLHWQWGTHLAENTDGPIPISKTLWHWGTGHLIADDPTKADPDLPKKAPHIADLVEESIATAQHEVLLISPYFIPRAQGIQLLTEISQRGISVKILTNSLASTDLILAHANYARSRAELLDVGIELYELVPLPPLKRKTLFQGKRSGISLHAKACVIDHRLTFIGSMNLDPRSALLNTEIGVLVESPSLSAAVAEFFKEATAPDSSYRVQLTPPEDKTKGTLYWTGEVDDEIVTFYMDPKTHFWRRFRASCLGLLPLKGML